MGLTSEQGSTYEIETADHTMCVKYYPYIIWNASEYIAQLVFVRLQMFRISIFAHRIFIYCKDWSSNVLNISISKFDVVNTLMFNFSTTLEFMYSACTL